jgi:hypothetical protein
MLIMHVPEWSVIRLPDGRIACVTNDYAYGKVVVKVCLDLTIRIDMGTDVEVIKYPAELAAEYVASHSE